MSDSLLCKVRRTSPNKLTQEQFVERSKEAHGAKYDYSLVQYTNNHAKVEIVCPDHGMFWQSAKHHMNGLGCRACSANSVSYTTEQFVTRANEIHAGRYDYSETAYTRAQACITFWCPKHQQKCTMRANAHTNGQKCPKCAYEDSSVRVSVDSFIEQALAVHSGRYDYSQVTLDQMAYNALVTVVCQEHGSYKVARREHLQGVKCLKCATEAMVLPNGEWIARAKEAHKNFPYDYSGTVYSGKRNPVTVKCLKHGPFTTKAEYHVSGAGPCPKCRVGSVGESAVALFFDLMRIDYETQKSFDDCRNPRTLNLLKFDFYLPGLGVLVEYDGKQHFDEKAYQSILRHNKNIRGRPDTFADLKFRDQVKNDYARSRDIPLIRLTKKDLLALDEVFGELLKKA